MEICGGVFGPISDFYKNFVPGGGQKIIKIFIQVYLKQNSNILDKNFLIYVCKIKNKLKYRLLINILKLKFNI